MPLVLDRDDPVGLDLPEFGYGVEASPPRTTPRRHASPYELQESGVIAVDRVNEPDRAGIVELWYEVQLAASPTVGHDE